MKELIGSAILIVSLLGSGSYAFRQMHRQVRKTVLEKTAKGLPPLTRLTRALRGEEK